jgi:hypothetical protein
MGRPLLCLEWIKAHVDYDGEDCLIWPFSRNNDGYAQVPVGNGKVKKASRIMCGLVKGPAPTRKHQVAHSCGRGHMGCVHPKHLSWKTHLGNRKDSQLHGTTYGRRGKAELQPAQVRAIRRSRKRHADLAITYNVTRRTIDRIVSRELWPSIR